MKKNLALILLSILTLTSCSKYTFENVSYDKGGIKNYSLFLNKEANEIISYCIEHYNEKLSLESLERALHINKYYISHVINGKIGTSFNAYINSLRISEAARLLIESDKTIKEISAEVGFGTVRSFDRAFKKQKGETAREYRDRNSEKVKKD